MDDATRLDLNKMINEYDAEDNTQRIRELKHSSSIRKDIVTMMELKKKYSRLKMTNPEQFMSMVRSRCPFLFENYHNIFYRLAKDNINVGMLLRFTDILASIEDGDQNQHEASYAVGKILKEIYIDSALREDKRKMRHKKKKEKQPVHNIRWSDYKLSAQNQNVI